MRQSKPSVQPAPPLTLRVNDLLFVNEYLKNGRNGTKAYQAAHHGCKANSARACAPKVLAKPSVQVEIARQIESASGGGLNRESINAWLRDIAKRAQDAKKIDTELRAVVEIAELAGLKVHKVEDVTKAPDVNTTQLHEELARRGYVAVSPN